MNPVFSVIIPAHNEEKYIRRCIRSVQRAAAEAGEETEILVVCNRCTDRTEEFAAAQGRILETIDADNRMTKGTLAEIRDLLATGKYIGGGAPIRFERYSFLLWLNDLLDKMFYDYNDGAKEDIL